LPDHIDKVWEWIEEQKLDTLKNKQKAFELTTEHFKDEFDSNEIRLYLLKKGFFDNKE